MLCEDSCFTAELVLAQSTELMVQMVVCVCMCVNQGGASHKRNPACTDVLMNSNHKPKSRSV